MPALHGGYDRVPTTTIREATMADHDRDVRMPTHDQPLNAPRRPTFGPLMATFLLLAVIAVVFLVMFVLR